MSKTTPPYQPEFRRRVANLVRAERFPKNFSPVFEPIAPSIGILANLAPKQEDQGRASQHPLWPPPGSSRRTITSGLPLSNLGLEQHSPLDSANATWDWGHPRHYVRRKWLLLRETKLDGYMVASGRSTLIRNLCCFSTGHAGLDPDRDGTCRADIMRPAEVDALLGDSFKAHQEPGWPSKTSLEDMAAKRAEADFVWYRARMAA